MAFDKITIDQFRGIRQCEIEGLGKRVNLFVGKNNCGKTSVLDAVFLISGISNTYLFYNINNFRECNFVDFENIASLNFYNLDFDRLINIKSADNTSKEKRDLKIKPLWGDVLEFGDENGVLSTQTKQKLKQIVYDFIIESGQKKEEYINTLEEYNNADDADVHVRTGSLMTKKGQPVNFHNGPKGSYLSSKSVLSFPTKDLSLIIENKQKELILHSLRKIEPRIKDIAIIQYRVFVDIGIEKMIPVEVLGDGIRRLLTIIVYLYRSRNGSLLIDEIDNGLHYSSMPVLWQTILDTAEQFNVQLYATTHNIDSLKALKETLAKSEYKKFQYDTVCFRLRRADDDKLIAYRFDYEKFEYAIESEHEIR